MNEVNKELFDEFGEQVDELELPGMTGAKVKDLVKGLVENIEKAVDQSEQQEKRESINQKSDRPVSTLELARSKRIIK